MVKYILLEYSGLAQRDNIVAQWDNRALLGREQLG